jgi:hypothetical protein
MEEGGYVLGHGARLGRHKSLAHDSEVQTKKIIAGALLQTMEKDI